MSARTSSAKFSVGQLIHHKQFDYRGVIVDVDPTFEGTEEWYDNVARSRPPKDKPWYHVLVHGADHQTYVAERNLETDDTGKPIDHPYVDLYFDEMRDGVYVSGEMMN